MERRLTTNVRSKYLGIFLYLSDGKEQYMKDLLLTGVSAPDICIIIINEMTENQLEKHKSGKSMYEIAKKLSLPRIANYIKIRHAWLRRKTAIILMWDGY